MSGRRVAALLATLATAAELQARSAPPAPLTPADRAAIATALDRGRLIYAYDQAAWHGTDAALAALAPADRARIGGWIVTGPAEAPVVTFVE